MPWIPNQKTQEMQWYPPNGTEPTISVPLVDDMLTHEERTAITQQPVERLGAPVGTPHVMVPSLLDAMRKPLDVTALHEKLEAAKAERQAKFKLRVWTAFLVTFAFFGALAMFGWIVQAIIDGTAP